MNVSGAWAAAHKDAPKGDAGVIEKPRPQARPTLKRPPRYKVLLHNDDFTPREFVVLVLKAVFHRGEAEARMIMLKAHRTGLAVAGVYSREIAETKITLVMAAAEEAGFPLLATAEPEDDGDPVP